MGESNGEGFGLDELELVESDVLEGVGDLSFDIMVRNGGYIGGSDEGEMEGSVLGFEGEVGLFGEEDGLGI